MSGKKKILVVNDDGIDAIGLRWLAAAARQYGQVWVIAPESQRSAMSHRITYGDPILVEPRDFGMEGVTAYACSGSPADCVRVGVLRLIPGGPDCVLSGINYGYNIASDIQYSATAGAALEASFLGVHAVAFSRDATECHEVTDRYLSELMGEFIEKPLPKGQIWNINFPGCPLADCRGVLRDRTVSGDPYYEDEYSMQELGDGRLSLQVIPKRNWHGTEGTDLAAMIGSYVSVGIVHNIH